jgi:hypothetical protein
MTLGYFSVIFCSGPRAAAVGVGVDGTSGAFDTTGAAAEPVFAVWPEPDPEPWAGGGSFCDIFDQASKTRNASPTARSNRLPWSCIQCCSCAR